jgi:hypothetical protein
MYEPTATGRSSPSTMRSASSVSAHVGSVESASLARSVSAGAAAVKKRRRCDSGVRS